MLLTTTGAKTGLPRTLPLLYLDDGDNIILIASNYGKTSHPAWYRNLVANPKVEVLAGKKSGTYSAAEITDAAERDRAWDLALDMYAGYGDYEGRAGDRTIPLVRLSRIAE
jgi:deazaflavin-dependent oxidoreductase (nitroreductase family)